MLMTKIPIRFNHEGKSYTGTLDEVHGSRDPKMWYLMIESYYYGILRLTPGGWVFDATQKTESMSTLADYSGHRITLVPVRKSYVSLKVPIPISKPIDKEFL